MELSIAKVRDNLADALNRVAYGGERVILMRRSKKVAALVSMEDLALLEKMENDLDVQAAKQARAEGGKPIPLAEIKARLGMGPKTKAPLRNNR